MKFEPSRIKYNSTMEDPVVNVNDVNDLDAGMFKLDAYTPGDVPYNSNFATCARLNCEIHF